MIFYASCLTAGNKKTLDAFAEEGTVLPHKRFAGGSQSSPTWDAYISDFVRSTPNWCKFCSNWILKYLEDYMKLFNSSSQTGITLAICMNLLDVSSIELFAAIVQCLNFWANLMILGWYQKNVAVRWSLTLRSWGITKIPTGSPAPLLLCSLP